MIDIKYPAGATPIDPDEMHGLIVTHITTRKELDRWEQDNIVEAMAWLDRTKPRTILTEIFMRELHMKMFGNVWRWAGKFRTTDKSIGGPWQQIPTSLKDLCDDTRLWIELEEDPPDLIALRFHHRLVSIHLFPNGNGRHARLMTDLLAQNILGCQPFSWGTGEHLSKQGKSRQEYIGALQAADTGDYRPLLAFARV